MKLPVGVCFDQEVMAADRNVLSAAERKIRFLFLNIKCFTVLK